MVYDILSGGSGKIRESKQASVKDVQSAAVMFNACRKQEQYLIYPPNSSVQFLSTDNGHRIRKGPFSFCLPVR